jgi:hypothetical protein
MNLIKTAGLALIGVAVTLPQLAGALEATPCTGACTTEALGVEFDVIIPAAARFQIGDATATLPKATFTATAADVGNNIALDPVLSAAANHASGVYYRLLSNIGPTTVTASSPTPTGLAKGIDTIPWSAITATSTAINSKTAIPMPASISANQPVPMTAGVVDAEGYFAYQYANDAVYPAGTYSGTITYTMTTAP